MLQRESRAAGVDGKHLRTSKSIGVKKWLDELMQELKRELSTAARTAGVDTQAGRKQSR